MADETFTDPRLAALYDLQHPDRADLAPYLDAADRLGARSVLDLGCGTGTLALLLAGRGLRVTAVDPAAASLAVARAKAGAEGVSWLHGGASALPGGLRVDLVTMTANTAQEITDPAAWHATLAAAFTALRPGGHLLFETRDPGRRAWLDWTPESTRSTTTLPDGGGSVTSWLDVLSVDGPLVTFRHTYAFEPGGRRLLSRSTLRFRDRAELAADLAAHGFAPPEVQDATDRPGLELVLLAGRPG